MARMRVALVQLNTVVGDLDGNVARVLDALDEAERAGADIAVFPELAITGYPPEDLVLKPGFVADNRAALDKVAARTGRCVAVVGFVDAARDLHNAAAVCAHGEVQGIYHKRLLPNYAVFDEQRTFVPGDEPLQLYVVAGISVGVSICEDAWSPTGPIAAHAAGGAEVVVNINASPFYAGRLAERERMLATRAADASCALVYVNQVGGQDELVFDGASLVFDANGSLVARAPQFTEGVTVVDLDVDPVYRKRTLDPRGWLKGNALPKVPLSQTPEPRDALAPVVAAVRTREAEIYDALGLRNARLRPQERFHRCRDRPVGWHRLIARRCASPRTRSAPSTCTAFRCPRGTRVRGHAPTRRTSPRTWPSTCARSPSNPRTPHCSTCSPPPSPSANQTSPRRTCRAASAASF